MRTPNLSIYKTKGVSDVLAARAMVIYMFTAVDDGLAR